MMATCLTMLLMSCESTKVEKECVVPELTFPVFPALSGEKKNGGGMTAVPDEWLIHLAEYRIRIEETEKTYNDIKALYGARSEK